MNGATAYMNVLRDTAILDLRKNNIIVLEEQLRQTRDRFIVGEVTRTDVAQAESSLATARSDYFTAQANLQTSIANYRQIIGVEPTRLEPARTIESPAAALAWHRGRACACRASRHSSGACMQRTRPPCRLSWSRANSTPTVNLVGNVQQNYNLTGVPGRTFLQWIDRWSGFGADL